MTAELESPPIAAPKPRRKRRWLKVLCWFGVLLVVGWFVALGLATWELHDATAALKARSQPTTYEEALASNESKASATNGAGLIRQALKENDRQGKPGDVASMMRGLFLNPIANDAVAGAKPWLEKGDSIVALLDQVVSLPAGPFTPVSDASKLSQSERDKMIQDVRSLGRLLYIDAKVSAATGDARRSFHRLKTLLLFSERLEAESFLIPQLVRIAILGLGDGAARFTLPLADFSSEELLELSNLAARLERNLKMAPALFNDRAMQASIQLDSKALKEELESEMMSRNRTGLQTQSAFVFFERRWIAIVSSPVGLPATRRAAAQTLRIPDDFLELVDLPPPWPKEAQARFDGWRFSLNSARLGLNPNPSDAMSIAYSAGKRARRRLAMLQVAYRLRRFQILRGKLPEKLEEICDAGMPTLPTTWFEGKPILYTKNGRSFTLTADPSIAPDYPPTNNQQKESLGLLFEFDADAGKPATGGR